MGLLLGALAPVFSHNPEGAVRKTGALTLALVLISGLASHTLLILNLPEGSLYLAFLYALVTVNDGFSELFGRAWGSKPLMEAISPNKTLGGALGGLLSTLAGSLLFSFLLPHLSLYQCALAGGLVALAGQVGDLVFSALKRDLAIKDFGALFPGHGGVLDRFDSLFFAAPFFYGFLMLVT
jgi:phosphatidate cytidylyltransferase